MFTFLCNTRQKINGNANKVEGTSYFQDVEIVTFMLNRQLSPQLLSPLI